MSWVAAGIASGAATHAAVKWGIDRRNAKKDAKNRPKYEIPEEVRQNLNAAQLDALQGMPEEEYQAALSNIQRGTTGALASAGTRKAGLSGIATLNQQQNDAYAGLNLADTQQRIANKQNLYGMRQNMADYRDQAFQFNVVNPYYEQIAARNQRNDALSQSLSSAAQMGVGAFAGGGAMGGSGKSSSATANTGAQKNPYGTGQTRIGTYNNPQTQNMFKQPGSQYNPYADNYGAFDNPQTQNMFKRPNQNPYY